MAALKQDDVVVVFFSRRTSGVRGSKRLHPGKDPDLMSNMFPARHTLHLASYKLPRLQYRSSSYFLSRWGSVSCPDRQFVPLSGALVHTRVFSTGQQTKQRTDPSRKTVTSILAGLQSIYYDASKLKNRVATSSYGRLMRLDKPIGTHLLFLPAAWSITLTASPGDTVTLLPLFYAGAVILRGAGCTINDIWDADLDRHVSRTQNRPIASGEISITKAFAFLGTQLFAGLGILSQLNSTSFLVGSLSVIPVLFYPLAKRRLDYPQAVLGITFNWGALLGYSAATGTLALPAFLLHGAGFCWTMVYDTIYAHQDKPDDLRVGAKSTALSFGGNTKPILAAFIAGKLALLTVVGMSCDLSLPYYVGITLSTLHLGKQVYQTDLSNSSQCSAAFLSNSKTGAITWAAVLLGRLL